MLLLLCIYKKYKVQTDKSLLHLQYTDKGRWIITLCVECNILKGCLDPAEFLQQIVRIVRNYRRLLPLCETIKSLDDLEQRINDTDLTFSFGKLEKSISAARKGYLDQLFKVEAPNLVPDIKSRFCIYCDIAFAGGVDRQDSSVSYPVAIKLHQALPSCWKDNYILNNRKLEDVLTHFCRILINIAFNWKRDDQIASIFLCGTDGMLSHLNDYRKPIKCMIDGVVVMFASQLSMVRSKFNVPVGTGLFAASIFEFNQWIASLTLDKLNEVRGVLGIHTNVEDPINHGKIQFLFIV